VDINQVGVPVDINHLETATVLLASTAPICMGHGMAARSG
jgi:microsomal dipeptidase-like Zn-dependent dipeptidase